MSDRQSNVFRPQLEALEDRFVPVSLRNFTGFNPFAVAQPPAARVTHQPPFIFNPFQQPQGISVPNLPSVSGRVTQPTDGGFFPPPATTPTTFFPPSLFGGQSGFFPFR